MKKLITNTEKQTISLGKDLGLSCRGGEIFLLSGDLGAGKTKFLQGLAKGLGVKGRVNSPTFNILKVYKAKKPIKFFCHIDAYRLRNGRDLAVLGIKEFFKSSDTVTAIEWAERVKDIWPKRSIKVKIKHLPDGKREINIK